MKKTIKNVAIKCKENPRVIIIVLLFPILFSIGITFHISHKICNNLSIFFSRLARKIKEFDIKSSKIIDFIAGDEEENSRDNFLNENSNPFH